MIRIPIFAIQMVKYKTFCVLVVMLFVISAANQIKAQGQSKLTIPQPLAYKVGGTLNFPLISKYKDTFSAKTGWGFFGEAEYFLNHGARFLPSIGYNNLGFFQSYTNDSGAIQRRKVTEHYIDIGAQISFLTAATNNAIRLNVGMAVSLLAARNTELPDILGRNITQRTLDNKKTLSPSLLLCVGVGLPLSNRVELGLQYNYALPAKIYPKDIVGRLGSFQCRLGYKIFTKKDNADAKEVKPQTKNYIDRLYRQDSLCIIVRLKENVKRIALLKSQGYEAEAQEVAAKTREENELIVEAFTKKVNLLPVYYFYDGDSKAALNGNFDGILLNKNFERDSSIVLPKKEYVFAEFARQFDEVSKTSGMFGLVLYNDRFKSIPSPFPSFVANFYGFLNKEEVLARFQKKLQKYFAE